MPFDGNGNYTLPTPSYPAIGGATISSTYRNTIDADLQTALSNCITRDGQSPVTANQPMAGFKHTGLGAGTVAGDSVRYEQLYGYDGYLTDSADATSNANFLTFAGASAANVTAATGRFTAPATGIYSLMACVDANGLGSAGSLAVSFRINDGATAYGTATGSVSTGGSLYFSLSPIAVVSLTAGDYITLKRATTGSISNAVCRTLVARRIG